MAKIRQSLFVDSMTLLGDKYKIESEVELRKKLSDLDSDILTLSCKLNELQKEKAAVLASLEKYCDKSKVPPLKFERATFSSDSTEEKAEFLLSLFSPRLDVFAKRSKNKGSDKTTYYPVCNNYWQAGCLKMTQKGKDVCKECKSKDYRKLTPLEIIARNFKNPNEDGINAVGIYPLRDDNTTRFVAIDLDESTWKHDAICILRSARNAGFSLLWERSFSGDGCHLWLFFSEDIDAKDARRLALSFVDKAREMDDVSMRSYDRTFPSQDTLGKTGIGNLILLPFVLSAAERGCTVFLDDEGKPYPLKKQFEYLSAVHRHSKVEVQTYLSMLNSSYLNGAEFALKDDDINPGWIRRIPKISKDDVKGELILYLSSGVSFDKSALSAKAQEAFRRMATISNPSYYKNLSRNGGYLGGEPSRIVLYEENERVLKLPRGLLDSVKVLLGGIGVKYSIEDHRISSTNLDSTFKGTLKDNQEKAIKQLLAFDIGILCSATGFGKTVVAISLISRLKERTLIVVEKQALANQWEEMLAKYLDVKTLPERKIRSKGLSPSVGVYHSGRKRVTAVIDIVTLQSLSSIADKGGLEDFDKYGLVIVDECHHIAAESFHSVVKDLSAKYVYGLSATVKRTDGLERIVFSECGPVRFDYEPSRLAYERGITQQYATRFSDTVVPPGYRTMKFSDILDLISSDEKRNTIIAGDISRVYFQGKKSLVLTRRVQQNKNIEEKLSELSIPCITLDGSMSSKSISSVLADLKYSEGSFVLIATDKLLGEGVDIPSLDTLFLASPYMQEGVLQQAAGRISREADGKHSTLIYDYVDYRIPICSHMFSKRIAVYKKLGFSSISNDMEPYAKMVYDDTSFLPALLNDMKNANKAIVISITNILPSEITRKILDEMNNAKKRGLNTLLKGSFLNQNMNITTSVAMVLKERSLVLEKSTAHRNYIIIDGLICWYGELNTLFISKNTLKGEKRKSILRIEDKFASESLLQDDLLSDIH